MERGAFALTPGPHPRTFNTEQAMLAVSHPCCSPDQWFSIQCHLHGILPFPYRWLPGTLASPEERETTDLEVPKVSTQIYVTPLAALTQCPPNSSRILRPRVAFPLAQVILFLP